jgi:hypothetical protein
LNTLTAVAPSLVIHCTKSLRDGPRAREGRQRWERQAAH